MTTPKWDYGTNGSAHYSQQIDYHFVPLGYYRPFPWAPPFMVRAGLYKTEKIPFPGIAQEKLFFSRESAEQWVEEHTLHRR